MTHLREGVNKAPSKLFNFLNKIFKLCCCTCVFCMVKCRPGCHAERKVFAQASVGLKVKLWLIWRRLSLWLSILELPKDSHWPQPFIQDRAWIQVKDCFVGVVCYHQCRVSIYLKGSGHYW